MASSINEFDQSVMQSMCSNYHAAGTDEMCMQDGSVRKHWHYLMQSLGDMGPDELTRRMNEAWRLIRENDVTYNLYGDQDSASRPWKLDLIPLLIESEEWRSIEMGLMQRAELLNLVLTDLYSSRSLIKKGLIPAELIYSHPGFLLPCVNTSNSEKLASAQALTFYAADLVRDASGQINVLSNRAQAPSGAGYALENRLVISRILPSLFRDSHTHRLANFFRSTRNALNALSPRDQDEPNIVLLSPGPANEAYFEHAYLANYLGYTLVEGSDLTVSENRVWLTTLEGRRPIDVILRRMDDSYCDPVELRSDSYLGVPGLTNAVRTGHVSIANPLGSGILESPALAAFLPALCQHLLGEQLRIPSVPVWWCGHKQQRQYVLDHLDDMVIKPVHPDAGYKFVFGRELDQQQTKKLRQQILAAPHLFVGQQLTAMSTVPVFNGDGLRPRHSVLRSFLVAGEHDYIAMPGGLTRVSPEDDTLVVSNQAGGISKDTWVLATEPEKYVSLLTERRQARLAPDRGGEVPGRVADNMFWVGRYAERAETISRILRHLLQFVETGENEETPVFLQLMTTLTGIPRSSTRNGQSDFELLQTEIINAINNKTNLNCQTQVLAALLRSVRSVRDRLSVDTWRIIKIIDEQLSVLQQLEPYQLSEALECQENLITALTAFNGLTQEHITRGRSWRFQDIGRRIERSLQIIRLLQSTLIAETSETNLNLLADSVLSIADSLMTYRRRYRYGIKVPALLELIIDDENNPRSLANQMTRMELNIQGLPRQNTETNRTELDRLTLETATLVRLADVNRLATLEQQSRKRETLEQFLNIARTRLQDLSDVLSDNYFRTGEQPHQLLSLRRRSYTVE